MKNSIFALLATLLYIFSSSILSAQDEDEAKFVSEEIEPYSANTAGSFNYSIPVDIPAFRGLSPNLRITYDSGRKSRGTPKDMLGIGWQVSGFSEITRVSQKLGTPTFTDANDIFLLDGQPLMACEDTIAVNAGTNFGGSYPDRFKTDQPSASCRSGGNFSTMRESDRKIFFDASAGTFTVYQKDGTRWIYKRLQELSGESPAANSDLENLLRSKWLLTEIRNRQSVESVVTFNYHFAPDDGYSYRPNSIQYGSYEVTFGYQALQKPLAQWATGAGVLGSQKFRLSSIKSFGGGEKISAYRFSYATSPEIEASRLTKVEKFGRDFQESGQDISGGSTLPGYDFTYATDQLEFEDVQYPGKSFGPRVTVWDYDDNGTDDLLFGAITHLNASCYAGPNADDRIVFAPHIPKTSFTMGSDRSIADLVIPQTISALFSSLPNSDFGSSTTLTSITRYDPVSSANKKRIALGRRIEWTNSRNGTGDNWTSSHFSMSYDSNGDLVQNLPVGVTKEGNYDLDPSSEFWSPTNRLYDLEDGLFIDRGSYNSVNIPSFKFDMDGDSMHEGLVYSPDTLQSDGWTLTEPQFAETASFTQRWIPSPATDILSATENNHGNDRTTTYHVGDVNGDSKDDLVIRTTVNFNDTKVYVSFSSGDRFTDKVLWTSGTWSNHIFARVLIQDINGDGLADLIFAGPAGQTLTQNCYGTLNPYTAGTAQILLSDGTQFVAPDNPNAREISNFASLGDFDGDGGLDIVSVGASGSVLYSESAQANLLTSLIDPLGGETTVSYEATTTAGSGNRSPSIRQVVKQITNSNGRGATRTRSFSYNDDSYDYFLRQPLGFKTVTTTLPKIDGESENPQLVTNYLNNAYGEAGTVRSRALVIGSENATWSQEIYYYSKSTSGNGPYVIRKDGERMSKRDQSGNLLETKRTFEWSDWGAPLRETFHGRSVAGVDVTPDDDVTTVWEYEENLDYYIVNKPKRKAIQTLNDTGVDTSTGLWMESYWYDNDSGSTNTQPVYGNLTKVREWTGDPSSFASRPKSARGYDARGNLVWEEDATGLASRTTNEWYDPDGLFLKSETNALGHQTSYSWDESCGVQTLLKNVNENLSTTMTYDVFCRPLITTYPDGNKSEVYYQNFGNAVSQHVRRRTRSGSNEVGLKWISTREYFDGFGQVYRTDAPGNTSSPDDDVVVILEFDDRGNKIAESNPLPFADAESSVPDSKKTRFGYDTLGRQTIAWMPDHTNDNPVLERTDYQSRERAYLGLPSMKFDRVEYRGVSCFDNNPETVCERTRSEFDARGNRTFEIRHDAEGSDVNVSAGWRVSQYQYDLLDRLIFIQDPVGATWNYTYDHYGNRTIADDPGLGTWYMTYDSRNLLTEQTDAKGQRIQFTYDALGRQHSKIVRHSDSSIESQTISTYDQSGAGGHNTGHLTTLTRGDHTINYEYSNVGSVLTEKHRISGREFTVENEYRYGKLINQNFPQTPGSTTNSSQGSNNRYDASGRMLSYADGITDIDYNLRGQPTKYTYASGVTDSLTYNDQRGLLLDHRTRYADGSFFGTTSYEYYPDGRASRMYTSESSGRFDYTYDYTGRLLSADADNDIHDQTFTYDSAGRMRTNSRVGAYNYTNSSPKHAPTNIDGDNFQYDANGNMTAGRMPNDSSNRKLMTYDAENRPLSVTNNGRKTRYEYAANGSRLKKIEDADSANESTTLYFNMIEIRNYGEGGNEKMLAYPHPGVRIANGKPSYLHTDRLGSTRYISDDQGSRDERRIYRPFGEEFGVIVDDLAAPEETKGFIGERYDMDAGLQYLNARYYDPELGSYIPPDE